MKQTSSNCSNFLDQPRQKLSVKQYADRQGNQADSKKYNSHSDAPDAIQQIKWRCHNDTSCYYHKNPRYQTGPCPDCRCKEQGCQKRQNSYNQSEYTSDNSQSQSKYQRKQRYGHKYKRYHSQHFPDRMVLFLCLFICAV